MEIDLTAPMPVLTRVARPWGEPIRCEVCARPCHPPDIPNGGALGRYRCDAHRNRRAWLAGEPHALRIARALTVAVTPPNPAIPLHEEIPVLSPDLRSTGTPPLSLRARLAARRAAERTQA